MKHEGSLPWSQEPATGSYHEPHEIRTGGFLGRCAS